jgi:hypothetical protein
MGTAYFDHFAASLNKALDHFFDEVQRKSKRQQQCARRVARRSRNEKRRTATNKIEN